MKWIENRKVSKHCKNKDFAENCDVFQFIGDEISLIRNKKRVLGKIGWFNISGKFSHFTENTPKIGNDKVT